MRVLLVDIDSLRPDHLGCHGYDRNTSPTIDGLAAEGVRFEHCFVSDSPCLPSRTALATGRFGAKTGVVTHFGEGQGYDEPGDGHDPDRARNLTFRQLFEGGVRTATVTSFAQRHLAYQFTAGFADHIQPAPNVGSVAQDEAAHVTDAARSWLDTHAEEEDWLLHVNYWDVHHPYEGIEPFVERVRESGAPAEWPDDEAIEAQRGATGPRTADQWPTPSTAGGASADDAEWRFPERIEGREDAEHFLDGYDAAIRKVDTAVEHLLDALDDAGIREETAVIVTGDHGEAFGEHGIYAEHALPHEACQRVPLIVSWPGVTDERVDTEASEATGSSDTAESSGESVERVESGESVAAFVYQFDLAATLCDLFGVEIPAGWDARSFAAALRGESFVGRERVVCSHGIYTFGRAVYDDRWTYIRLCHPGAFSVPGLYNDPESGFGLELLHDRHEDPHGTTNLIEERPEVATELREHLDSWVAETTATGERDAGGIDSLAAMAATDGPFLYYDPEALAALYRDRGRSGATLEPVERAREYPRS